MFRLICAALLCLTLTSASFPTKADIVIDHDEGGEVKKYNQRYFEYHASGDEVVIAGSCMSACTRFISLPNVCAEPEGYLYFHGITIDGKVDPVASLADSKRWETPKAVALQVKYGATSFGVVARKASDPSQVALEPGVWRTYERIGPGLYQVWLKVKADKLVRPCA